MNMIIGSMIYSLPPMMLFIAGLAIAFRCYRSHAILQDAVNFKRGRWVAFFVSLGVFGVGVLAILFGWFLDLLDRHYFHSGEKLGFGFPFYILGFAIGGFGALCLWFSGVICLTKLLSALISHVHSVQSKRAA